MIFDIMYGRAVHDIKSYQLKLSWMKIFFFFEDWRLHFINLACITFSFHVKRKKYAFNKSLTLKKDSQNVTFEKGRFLHLYINFKQNAYVIYVHCLQEWGLMREGEFSSNCFELCCIFCHFCSKAVLKRAWNMSFTRQS